MEPLKLLRLSPFAILVLSNVLEMLCIALILPCYPKVCESFGITLKTRGMIISVYSFFQFISSPILGRMSDVVGRVMMLRLSAIASISTYVIMILAHDQTTFMLARTIPGLLKSSIATSQAYLTDISVEKDRAKNLGVLGAGYGVAFIIGPALGGILMVKDLILPVKIAMVFAILNFCLLFFLPEPNSPPSTPKEKVEEDDQQQEPRDKKHENGQDKVESLSKKKKAKHSLWYIIRHTDNGGKIAGLLARKFMVSCAMGLFETSLIEFCSRELGLHGPILGLILSYLGVLSVLNNALIIRVLTKKFKDSQILLPAIIGLTISMLMWGYTKSLTGLLPVLAALSICSSIFTTLTSAEISRVTPHEMVGTVLGISYAIEMATKIIAPPIGGAMLEKQGAYGIGWCGVIALSPCVLHVALAGFPIDESKEEAVATEDDKKER